MEGHRAGEQKAIEDGEQRWVLLASEPTPKVVEAAGSSDGLGAAWKFWRRRRHVLTLLAFFGHMFKVILRVNMNVAVVAMTERRPVSDQGNATAAYEQEFDWDGGTKGLLLSVFFYGYTLTQIPGGILATRLGGNTLFGWGIAFTSVTTVLTPTLARIHVHLLMAVRFAEGLAEGFLSASIELLWGRWVPVHERSRHVAFACSGIPWGDIVGLSVSGLVAANLGWPAIFYITGACGLVWFLFWWIIVKEHPHLDPRIKPSELEYIQRSLGPTTQEEVRIPFLAILTSLPVWAILVAGMSNCWNHYTFAMHLPTYLNDVMQFDLQQAGLLSAVPYLVEVSLLFVFAHLADTLANSSRMGLTATRKTCICGCLVIIAAATLLVGHMQLPTAIMACLSILQTFDGVAWSMMLVNQLDIAPRHASILTGLHHTMCSLTGSTGPVLTGYVTQGKRAEDWVVLFYIAAGVNITAATFYALYGSARVQSWAVADSATEDDKTTEDKMFSENKMVSQDKLTGEDNMASQHKKAGEDNVTTDDNMIADDKMAAENKMATEDKMVDGQGGH